MTRLDRRRLREEDRRRRLDGLAERCRLLASGLHNDEGDPSLVFDRVGYGDAMRAALSDPDVRAALALLPANYFETRTER